jgi:transcriptional regulator with XRE-family HTH domain
MTQAQLGVRLGVDGSHVRHYEAGRRSLSVRARVELHELSGIPLLRLLTREEVEIAQRVAAILAAAA